MTVAEIEEVDPIVDQTVIDQTVVDVTTSQPANQGKLHSKATVDLSVVTSRSPDNTLHFQISLKIPICIQIENSARKTALLYMMPKYDSNRIRHTSTFNQC